MNSQSKNEEYGHIGSLSPIDHLRDRSALVRPDGRRTRNSPGQAFQYCGPPDGIL
jgi:hypothetical protein